MDPREGAIKASKWSTFCPDHGPAKYTGATSTARWDHWYRNPRWRHTQSQRWRRI